MNEAFQVLSRAVSELPPQMRRCVSLRVRDVPYQAIADGMEIGLPSVKTHLSLARQRLRPVLDKYFKRIEL